MTATPTEAVAAPAVTLGWSDRLLPLLLIGSIGVGLAVGAVAPGLADSLAAGVSIGVFALIYLVMLGVGLGGLARIAAERRFLAAAVGLNFVINPLLAWGLSTVFLAGSADLQVGLILFLVTPCIGWYLVFTEMAGGDTALGVSLLGVNVVLQVLLLPLYLIVFIGDSTSIPASAMVRSVALYLVAPAALAAFTRTITRRRRRRRRPTTETQPPIRFPSVSTLKTVALAVVIVSMFASQRETIVDNPSVFGQLVLPVSLFFVITFAMALAVGHRLGIPDSQVSLLAFTTTSRNSEASLAIAATAFSSPLVGLTVVLGPVIELPLLVVMVGVLNRRRVVLDKKQNRRHLIRSFDNL